LSLLYLQSIKNNLKNKKMSTTRKRKTASKRPSARKQTNRKSNSVISLENGIQVIKLALRRKLSISAAAIEKGHGRNYVSDIKARLEENYRSKNITRDLYTTFKSLNKKYEKVN